MILDGGMLDGAPLATRQFRVVFGIQVEWLVFAASEVPPLHNYSTKLTIKILCQVAVLPYRTHQHSE